MLQQRGQNSQLSQSTTDFGTLFIQYQDYLAPRLDVYEQALYLYIARHTIAVGQAEATIGFKSARKKMAFGVGTPTV